MHRNAISVCHPQSSDSPPTSALRRVLGKNWLPLESFWPISLLFSCCSPSRSGMTNQSLLAWPEQTDPISALHKKSQNHTRALRMNRGKKEERRKQRQASDLLKALQLKPPSQRRSHFNKIEFKWWRQKLHEREGGREFLALVIVEQEKWHNIVYREPKATRLNSSVEHCSYEPFASNKKS